MRPTDCIPIPMRVLGVDTRCAEVTVTCKPLLPMGILPDPLDVVDWHKWLLCGVVAPYPSARERAARRAAQRHGRNRS
jgi:chloramphenicol 3-O-phosphotransferase